jgi:glycogen operon protein
MAFIFDSSPISLELPPTNPVESAGRCYPLGATIVPGGVNFSIFSRDASEVELLLFDQKDDVRPARVIRIDPLCNRTYHYWHVFVAPGVQPGQLYGCRVQGPFEPASGLRFDPSKVLLDPYGRGVVVPADYSREAASREGDNTAKAMKSVVVGPAAYDWEGDKPLQHRPSRTIIYEMHVRGFTWHASSELPPETRGTYIGVTEKIPYLRALGIDAVKLMPVFHAAAPPAFAFGERMLVDMEVHVEPLPGPGRGFVDQHLEVARGERACAREREQGQARVIAGFEGWFV